MPSAKNGLSQDFLLLLDGFGRSSEHVVVTDKNGLILFANKAAVLHTGYGTEEMLGKKPGEVWGGNMPKEAYMDMWQTIAKQKQAYVGEMHNKRKNSEMYWQQVHIIPVLDEQGEPQYYIGIELDVDAQSQHEALMQAATSGQLSSSVQVRWPLGWLFEKGNLSHQELLELQRHYADENALDNLVADLLALSSVHRAQLESAEEFSLVDLTRDVMEKVRIQYPDRQYAVNASEGSFIIHEKKRLLHIVLERMIANAALYSPTDDGTVQLTVLRSGKQFIVRCQDNGIGISFQEQRHLFEKYFRGPRARILHPHGSGLGLFLMKSIADACGWQVHCISEENQGARFDLILSL